MKKRRAVKQKAVQTSNRGARAKRQYRSLRKKILEAENYDAKLDLIEHGEVIPHSEGWELVESWEHLEYLASQRPSPRASQERLKEWASEFRVIYEAVQEKFQDYVTQAMFNWAPARFRDLADAMDWWTQRKKRERWADPVGFFLELSEDFFSKSRTPPTIKDYQQFMRSCLRHGGIEISDRTLYDRIHELRLPLASRGGPRKKLEEKLAG